MKIDTYCTKLWYKLGTDILHRDDGPAVVTTNGLKKWYKDGKLHRLDGPAVIWPDGKEDWYIDGRHYDEEYFYDHRRMYMKENRVSFGDFIGTLLWLLIAVLIGFVTYVVSKSSTLSTCLCVAYFFLVDRPGSKKT